MKVLLSSAATDKGCISLKRSIDYISKQIKSIELRIEWLIFDDKQITINYELLSSIKGVGCVVLYQPIYQTGNFIRFDNLSSFLVIVVLSRVGYSVVNQFFVG